MTPSKLTTTVAALLLTASLAACTDDSGPKPSGDGSNRDSSSAAAAPADRSDEVFKASKKPKVLATVSGTVNLGVGKDIRQFEEDVTFEVTDIKVTSDATVLQYQLTAEDGDAPFGMEGRYWYDQPSLQVPGTTKQMQSVTASLPKGTQMDAMDICVCTAVRAAGEDPRPQTVLYPQLPDGADKVEVILPGLKPVTVPVTR